MPSRWEFVSGLWIACFIVSSCALSLCAASSCTLADGAFQVGSSETNALPEATAEKLPRWRGFNLLEKFHLEWSNDRFRESDFELIHDLGFNFVRLPMDYRTWIRNKDWEDFDERTLKEIDDAVQWGEKHSIHVCLNFHRAPGYTVASPAERTNLWKDADAQRVCARHWAMFAKRYRGIPNRRLSFNLFNEPANVSKEAYVAVVQKVVKAIRNEDPDRLIISDGLTWGLEPVMELKTLGIAQATRGYTPSNVTHYKASWVEGSGSMPEPTWPRTRAHGTLYSPQKSELAENVRRPLVIQSSAGVPQDLRFRVTTVSANTTLRVTADEQVIFENEFQTGPGKGPWKRSKHFPQWNSYQCVYDRDYNVTVPTGAKRVEFSVTTGDWLSLSQIAFQINDDVSAKLNLHDDWGKPPASVEVKAEDGRWVFRGETMEDRRWLLETVVRPWQEASQSGMGVMVGEFGCHNQTPHKVTLRWMEDCLMNYKQVGMGWALWNLRGSFGIIDSQRRDVKYERYKGYRLDRKMLDLLQRY